jgi:hypothetical protein
MGYFKTVALDIQEAIAQEAMIGFDSSDEKKEVFLEIAEFYDVSLPEVYTLYFQMKTEGLLSAQVI